MDSISSRLEDEDAPTGRGRPPWLSYAALVVAGLLIGATGIAVAADDTASTTATPTATAKSNQAKSGSDKAKDARGKGAGAKNGKWRHAGKHLMPGGPAGAALHGEFVVPAGDNTFQTLAVQRGRVVAVSARSITLRSADGFVETYVVGDDTRVKARGGAITSLADGSNVHVVAIRKGNRLTAQLVHERPSPGEARDKPKPKPAATPTSSGTPT